MIKFFERKVRNSKPPKLIIYFGKPDQLNILLWRV